MQYVREISGLDTTALCAYLQTSAQPFEFSQLFDASTGKKVVDDTERSSHFRAIKDPKLFEIAERLVEQVSASDESRHLSLVRNDVTQIVYQEGDFFKKHQDYLAVTSNIVEEYTLIICVTPEDKLDPGHATSRRTRGAGGQTVVYTHGEILTSASTTTPRCGLLFRKDLPHEALRLESGEKHVVTLNLWATARSTSSQERILLVSFPRPADPTPSPAKRLRTADAGRAHMRSMAYDRSYALTESKVAHYDGSFLAGLMLHASDERIVRHECTLFSYEQFGAVFKVLNNARITYEELADAAEAIDFYGLPTRNLLVELSKALVDEAESKEAGHSLDEVLAKPWHSIDEPTILRELHERVPRLQAMEWDAFAEYINDPDEGFAADMLGHLDAGMLDSLVEEGWREKPPAARTVRWLKLTFAQEKDKLQYGDVIVCSSLERTRVVSAEARAHSLPYLPFRICFVEGTIELDGDAAAVKADEHGSMWPGRSENWTDGLMQGPPTALQMHPAWISLGDYDNILYARHLLQLSAIATGTEDWKASELLDLEWPPIETPRRKAVLDQVNALVTLYPASALDDLSDVANEEELDVEVRSADIPLTLYSGADDQYSLIDRLHAGLKLALPAGDGELSRRILDMIFAGAGGKKGLTPTEYQMLPQGEAPPGSLPSAVAATPSDYFHVDALGKACFSADEALRASRRVIEMDLVESVKAALNKTEFVLPQVQVNESTFFCNESVYGKATILMVTGVVSLEKA